MYILIDKNGLLSLEEHEEFKSFSIIDKTNNSNRSALDHFATPDADDHYWLEISAVAKLSPEVDDPSWQESFQKMLKAVEPYGYADLQRGLVKAHVEAPE